MSKGMWEPVTRDTDVLFTGITPRPLPLTPKDIPPPDSPLIKEVFNFAKSHLEPKTFNHSNRIYYFGLAIVRAAFPEWEVDEETYYATCLLHDIGLADAFHLTTKMSFEFKGGIVAREFLLKHGASEEQADSVCEAIILHQDIWVKGGNIHQNGMMIIFSTLFDNAGKFADCVDPVTVKSVCEAFPRNSWSEAFACAVEKEMREKPWSHTTTFEQPGWRQGERGSQFGNTARGNKLMEPYD